MTDDSLPLIDRDVFRCPHCSVVARQNWYSLAAHHESSLEDSDGKTGLESASKPTLGIVGGRMLVSQDLLGVKIANCHNCESITIWIGDELVYPDIGTAPPPNGDLSEAVRADYDEAVSVFSKSPRSAAALLRLGVQRLCAELGVKEKNLNDAIGELVKQGLDPIVQRALDVIRLTGNAAVHPGELDSHTHPKTVYKLFDLLNFIAKDMITRPKEIHEAFDYVSGSKKTQIEQRDAKKAVD